MPRRTKTDLRTFSLTPEQIGARLRAAREERGISQTEAAIALFGKEAGITRRGRISEYESGARLPSLEMFYSMVLALGLDPETLLGPEKI